MRTPTSIKKTRNGRAPKPSSRRGLSRYLPTSPPAHFEQYLPGWIWIFARDQCPGEMELHRKEYGPVKTFEAGVTRLKRGLVLALFGELPRLSLIGGARDS